MNAKSKSEIFAGKSIINRGVSVRFGPHVLSIFMAVTTEIVLIFTSWMADENRIVKAQIKGRNHED